MSRTPSVPTAARTRVRGFTLIEMMIVGVMIVVFSGIAMFAVREMYDENVKKAGSAEVHSIATALSHARDDLAFFPRLSVLDMPLDRIYFPSVSAISFANGIRPGIDMYGAFEAKNY